MKSFFSRHFRLTQQIGESNKKPIHVQRLHVAAFLLLVSVAYFFFSVDNVLIQVTLSNWKRLFHFLFFGFNITGKRKHKIQRHKQIAFNVLQSMEIHWKCAVYRHWMAPSFHLETDIRDTHTPACSQYFREYWVIDKLNVKTIRVNMPRAKKFYSINNSNSLVFRFRFLFNLFESCFSFIHIHSIILNCANTIQNRDKIWKSFPIQYVFIDWLDGIVVYFCWAGNTNLTRSTLMNTVGSLDFLVFILSLNRLVNKYIY